jgi:hypothetical protein
MLYASLTTSLFSAFLAMLGKQWLHRYASTDMRGTAMERSQDRQRKLDGIVTWYFDHVLESLPLMLQFALLLLGCALSRYLWGIDVTVAHVVLGVTTLGAISYAFVIVAGTASASCPYQTPGARILRHIHYHILRHILYRILPHIIYHILPRILYHTLPHLLYHTIPPFLSLLRSALHDLVYKSASLSLFTEDVWGGWGDWGQNFFFLLAYILCLPFFLAYDAYLLTRVMVKVLIPLACRVPGWLRRVHGWLHGAHRWICSARSARARRLNQRAAVLDAQCISWILRTSLEKGIRLSTLKFLATTPTLVDFNPAFVSRCFDILTDCIKVNGRNPVVVQGMEQLAEASAMCFFLTYSHLSITHPTSSFLADIRQHYRRVFPLDLNSSGLPFPRTLGIIHQAIHSRWEFSTPVEWRDYKPTNHEHIAVAHALSELSWSECQGREFHQVPPPCLPFALHYLSQDPLPPLSITTDCLLIIAIDLGCNVPNTMVLGERYAHTWRISTTLLTNSQCAT